MDDVITPGEIARSLARLEALTEAHRSLLDDIRVQVTQTNGRVNAHDREIKDLKVALGRAVGWWLMITGTVIAGVAVWMVTRGQ